MGLICKLPEIMAQAKAEYETMAAGSFHVSDSIGAGSNILARGDNAAFMKYLMDEPWDLTGKIQQIYIDPPFFSKASYDAVIKLQGQDGETRMKHAAYEDVWKEGMAEYLKMLAVRIYMMRDLLSKEGTIWVHLDWHGVHYVKILMDEIFGEKNFINEIVWQYKSGGSSKKHFARKHDTILVYGKTGSYYINLPKEKSYNRGLKPYRFKGVEEFCDDVGWYTMVNMKDVWSIDMVGRTSAERTGYATQKPEALMERIIAAGSREGDIVADFFCGSGTLAVSAGKLGRKWICCDEGKLAVATSMKRLLKDGGDMVIMQEQDDSVDSVGSAGSVGFENSGGSTKSDSSAGSGAKFVVEVSTWPSLFNDKINCTVQLKNYQLQTSDLACTGPARETISKAAGEDPLALIDYWCIDFYWEGKDFCPHKFFLRGKKGLCCAVEKELDAELFAKSSIMVKAVDIFGNISTVILEK